MTRITTTHPGLQPTLPRGYFTYHKKPWTVDRGQWTKGDSPHTHTLHSLRLKLTRVTTTHPGLQPTLPRGYFTHHKKPWTVDRGQWTKGDSPHT